MGNLKTHLINQDAKEYPFAGREKDISKICELLQSNRVVQIYGLDDIGTSRVMKRFIITKLSETKCLYKDFSLATDGFDTKDVPIVLLKLRDELLQNKENRVKAFGELSFKDTLKVFMEDAAKLREEVVLLLDNVDAVKNEYFKKSLMEFLQAVVKQATSLKVVFTSSSKLRMTTNGFANHKIKGMNAKEIRQLFDAILKSKKKTIVSNDDDDDDDDLSNILGTLESEENKKFMDVLINLCCGLPKLAMMTVSLLTDYDGLLEPKDLIVLMIEDNLNTLSPDCYPSQDRADTYKEVIKELKTRPELLLLYRINRQMNEDNSASVNTVITCVPDAKSNAHAKQAATPLLDHNVMSYNIKKKEFDMIHILRECCLAMDPLDEGNKEELQKDLKEALIKSTQLDVPDNVANSPRELEKYLESLEESYIKSQQQKQTDPTNKEDATVETKENNEFQLPYSAETLINQRASVKPSSEFDNFEYGTSATFANEIDRKMNGNTNDLSFYSLSGPSAMSYRNLPSDDIDGSIPSVEDNTTVISHGDQEANEEHIKLRPSEKSGDHNKKGDPIPAPITEHGAANPREQGSYGETSKVPTDEHGASKPKEQDDHGAYNQKEQDNHGAYQPRDQNNHGAYKPMDHNYHDAYNQMEQDTHGAYKQREQDNHGAYKPRDQDNHGAYNQMEQDKHGAYNQMEQDKHGARKPREQDNHGSYKPREQDNHGAYNQKEEDKHGACKPREQDKHRAYNQMEQDKHGAYKPREQDNHRAYKLREQDNHGASKPREQDNHCEPVQIPTHEPNASKPKEHGHYEEPTQITKTDYEETLSNTFDKRKHADNDLRKTEILPCDFGTEITGIPIEKECHVTTLTGTGWKTKSTDRTNLGQLGFENTKENLSYNRREPYKGFVETGNENHFIASMMPDDGVKPKYDHIAFNGQKDRLEEDVFHKLNLGLEGYRAEQKTLNDSD